MKISNFTAPALLAIGQNKEVAVGLPAPYSNINLSNIELNKQCMPRNILANDLRSPGDKETGFNKVKTIFTSENSRIRNDINELGYSRFSSNPEIFDESYEELVKSWDELKLDTNLNQGEKYRYRSFQRYDVSDLTSTPRDLNPQKEVWFFQPKSNNPVFGDRIRTFPEMTPGIYNNPALHDIINKGLSIIDPKSENPWKVGVHQIRINPDPKGNTTSTPEGIHQDGFDYVFQIFIDRDQVESSTSRVYDAEYNELENFDFSEPLDSILVDDRNVYHSVDAMKTSSYNSHRDMLIITYAQDDLKPDINTEEKIGIDGDFVGCSLPSDTAKDINKNGFHRGDIFSKEETSSPEWNGVMDDWNNLYDDEYLGSDVVYRQRRFDTFSYNKSDGLIKLPHGPLIQSSTYNKATGGMPRFFEPLTSNLVSSRIFNSIVNHGLKVFGQLEEAQGNEPNWFIEVHQYRVKCGEEFSGNPTPEGIHKDGRDYVLIMLAEKSNVQGGMTTVYNDDKSPITSFTLDHPADMVLLDDRAIMHGVSNISPAEGEEYGYRDTLVVTFTNKNRSDTLYSDDNVNTAQ